MKAGGSVPEASQSSFGPTMLMIEDEFEATAHMLDINYDQYQEPNLGMQSMYLSDHNSDSYYSSENCIPYYWSQGNCSASSTSNVNSGISSYLHILDGHEGYYFDNANVVAPAPMNFSVADEEPTLPLILMNEEASSDEAYESMENQPEPLLPSDHCSQAMKRKMHEADLGKPEDDCQLESSMKSSRIISAPVPKKGKNAQSKKRQKSAAAVSNEAESNVDTNAQSSSSCSSEDDSSVWTESNGGTTSSSSKGSGSLILNGKTRADRGSATDPQSLYARKRRERINERLRILQNLVPNGTKVDISTMLEEAVQYVKFLQTD